MLRQSLKWNFANLLLRKRFRIVFTLLTKPWLWLLTWLLLMFLFKILRYLSDIYSAKLIMKQNICFILLFGKMKVAIWLQQGSNITLEILIEIFNFFQWNIIFKFFWVLLTVYFRFWASFMNVLLTISGTGRMFWKDNHWSNGISAACTGISFTIYYSSLVSTTFPFIIFHF